MAYWLYRHDGKTGNRLDVDDSRIDDTDIIFAWNNEQGLYGVTKNGNISKAISGPRGFPFVALPQPIKVEQVFSAFPELRHFLDGVGPGEFQFIPPEIGTALHQFAMSNGKILPNRPPDSTAELPRSDPTTPPYSPTAATNHTRETVTPADSLTEACDAIAPPASRGLRYLLRAAAFLGDQKTSNPGIVSPATLLFTIADVVEQSLPLNESAEERRFMTVLAQAVTSADGYATARDKSAPRQRLPGPTDNFPLRHFQLSSAAQQLLLSAGRRAEQQGSPETTIQDVVATMVETNSGRLGQLIESLHLDVSALRTALGLPPLAAPASPERGKAPLPPVPRILRQRLEKLSPPPSGGVVQVLLAATAIAMGRETAQGEISTTVLAIAVLECATVPQRYGFTPEEAEPATLFRELIADTQAYRQQRTGYVSDLTLPPDTTDLNGGPKKVTDNVWAALATAATIARQAGLEGTDVGCLIRGILNRINSSPLFRDLLDNVDGKTATLSQRLEQRLAERRSPHPTTFRSLSDHVDKADEDLLGIDGDAQTLARFVASRQTKPPMAVALFGEWGLGKSFFAKRVQAHVNTLAKQARGIEKTQPLCNPKNLPYHAHICQVEFNAWHYIESDLWASLVDHIVTSLDQYMSGHPEQRKELLSQVSQCTQELEVANKKVEEAQATVNEADRKVTAAESDVRTYDIACQKVQLDWPSLWRKAHTTLMNDKKLADSLDKACNELGLEPIGKNAAALQTAYIQTNEMITVWRPLLRQLKPHWWKIVGGVVAIWALVQLLVPDGFQLWTTLGTQGVAGLALLSLVFGRVHAAGRLITTVFTEVQSLTHGQQSEAELQLSKLRQQQNSASNQLTIALDCKATAQAALDEAERELAALQPDIQMREFFAQRMADKTYSKHLGLVATIRQDFARLSELLAEREGEGRKDDLPALRRIILYVDDLDRCPPQVVLKVLQAIHLLLAFPLFVVVVAVDVRWLVRTLREEHPFLAAPADPSQELHDHATAEDYLEKIFQVPYWVRPMDGTAAASYVQALMKDSEILPPPTSHDTARNTDDGVQEDTLDQEDTTRQSDNAKDRVGDNAEKHDQDTQDPTTTPNATDFLVPIRQSPQEIELARNLAPYLGGSPRRSKRFINLYLLTKLSLNKEQYDNLVASKDCACIMVLLALLTAMPRGAVVAFDTLAAKEDDILKRMDLAQCALDGEEKRRAQGILAVAEKLELPRKQIQRWLPLARRHLFSVTPPPSSPATA